MLHCARRARVHDTCVKTKTMILKPCCRKTEIVDVNRPLITLWKLESSRHPCVKSTTTVPTPHTTWPAVVKDHLTLSSSQFASQTIFSNFVPRKTHLSPLVSIRRVGLGMDATTSCTYTLLRHSLPNRSNDNIAWTHRRRTFDHSNLRGHIVAAG